MNELTGAFANIRMSERAPTMDTTGRLTRDPRKIFKVFSEFHDFFPDTEKACRQWEQLTPIQFFTHYAEGGVAKLSDLKVFLGTGARKLVFKDTRDSIAECLDTFVEVDSEASDSEEDEPDTSVCPPTVIHTAEQH